MSETELIQQIAAAVAQHVQPAVPVNVDLWDIATIARVFKRSEMQVRERMACLPDFPKAIRLPSTRSGRGQALYRATEVLEWAGKYQDRH